MQVMFIISSTPLSFLVINAMVIPVGGVLKYCFKETDGEFVILWNEAEMKNLEQLSLFASWLDESYELGVKHKHY